LLPVEHGFDATFNISTWMDKYLMAPFAPAFVLDADAAASSSEAAPETGVATQAATDTAANQAATEAAAGEESKGD